MLAVGTTYSFEFFPPKNHAEQATLTRALHELEPLRPSFVSVTHRGAASSRRRTFDLVTALRNVTTLEPMPHLTCVGHTRLGLADELIAYRKADIDNLMALGGDHIDTGGAAAAELRYAAELVELAHAIGGFCIGVAAHPAGHPSSSDIESDRGFLAEKLACADFAVTQFFFDAALYEQLLDDLARRGVRKPVLPGIMPITSLASIPRMAKMGAAVPEWACARLAAAYERGGDEAVRAQGISMAIELCRALLDTGAPGLHFYTLNRSTTTAEICRALGRAPLLSFAG